MFCAIARSSQSANACRSFWVAEKSDGVRVLLFVQTDQAGGQMVYLVSPVFRTVARSVAEDMCGAQIDRHNAYRQLSGLYFPHHEDPRMPLKNSIVDGELVIDVDPRTKQVCEFVPLRHGSSAEPDLASRPV